MPRALWPSWFRSSFLTVRPKEKYFWVLIAFTMDKDILCDSLLIWLQTFSIDGPRETVEDLTDGIAMSQVLNQIAPLFFTETWMSKIKQDASSNWRLKVSNLKKILKGILDFYSDSLGQHIRDFHMPDVNAIGEKNDMAELGRLLQLILGCAVNCEDKQEYIQRIMSMEESVQHVVMNAIQELMTKEAPAGASEGSSEIGDQLKKTLEELNTVMEAKEEISQRCHELDLQVSALQEENATLAAENEKINDRLNQAESLDDPTTPAGRRYQQLQSQVELLQEEAFRTEASKDDLRIKIELQEKEILELQQKNEEMNELAEEARSLKDEVDVLRHTADKVSKMEAAMDSYKKKLEELSDLRGQVKMLEEKNTSYMQKHMELEEELRKSNTYKSQLDLYKRQTQEMQMKLSEETKKADKAEFESKRQQEKMVALQREKERLIEERDSLKDINEELRCTRAQQDTLMGDTDSPTLASGMDLMNVPPEIKEKIMRLQHENKMLKLQKSTSDDEQGQLLQTMLDDANSRISELESENRIANQRIMELEAQLEDFQENQQRSNVSSEDSNIAIRKTLNEQIQKSNELDKTLQTKTTLIEEIEVKLSTANEKVEQLEDQLHRKDEEMKVMEDRYKKYLDKARNVIKTLDPKHNPGGNPEVQALRNQLQEKERLAEHLEKENEKAKTIREKEERLMVTAWYNLGMKLHRKAVDERLANIGAGQSFLARQRQAQTRRPQAMTTSPPHQGSR